MIAFFFQLCIIYTLPFSIFFDGFLHSQLFCDACAAAFFRIVFGSKICITTIIIRELESKQMPKTLWKASNPIDGEQQQQQQQQPEEEYIQF